ncbi:TPA: cysteine peptidase family C39 domain-containing protein [Pseudomonas aeruginosa]
MTVPSDSKSQRLVTMVRQEDSHGCGVACLAMIAGITYHDARQTFAHLGYGVARKSKQPFSSNFTELMAALREHGIRSEMKRWQGWEQLDTLGILKVDNGCKNSWHWVVARPHPDFKVVIHDPSSASESLMEAPPIVGGPRFGDFRPYGNWVRIA